jgi:thiazole tautomerase (transcriptional regulator TenI)
VDAPRLLGITPAEFSPEVLARLLPGLSRSLDTLLLRWPGRSARFLLETSRSLAAISPRPRLLLSDRIDIALIAGLDGVQLKESSLPPASIPARLRPGLLGISRHDEAGVIAAVGCDYLTLSPLFETNSKPGASALGMARLGGLVECSPIPVLALGGVRPEQIPAILALGARGVAVSGGIFGAPDPVEAATAYAKALRDARRA